MTRGCTACGRETANNKFCCRSCAASHNNSVTPKRKKVVSECKICQAPIAAAAMYCSRECVGAGKREWQPAWTRGEHNPLTQSGRMVRVLRKLLMEMRGAACEACGWSEVNPVTGLSPLEVDHIDGDRANNFIINLKLLCPNCHSLTPTYRYLNSAKSKAKRSMV